MHAAPIVSADWLAGASTIEAPSGLERRVELLTPDGGTALGGFAELIAALAGGTPSGEILPPGGKDRPLAAHSRAANAGVTGLPFNAPARVLHPQALDPDPPAPAAVDAARQIAVGAAEAMAAPKTAWTVKQGGDPPRPVGITAADGTSFAVAASVANGFRAPPSTAAELAAGVGLPGDSPIAETLEPPFRPGTERPAPPSFAGGPAAAESRGARLSATAPELGGVADGGMAASGARDEPATVATLGGDAPRAQPVADVAQPTTLPLAGPDARSPLAATSVSGVADTFAAPQRGETPEALAHGIRAMFDHRLGEARLTLNPPDLGTVDVKIAVTDDQTYVQLVASSANARDELEQWLPRLRELLSQGGLELAGATVTGGRDDRRAGHAEPWTSVAAEIEADGLDRSRPTKPRLGGGRIDLYA